MHFFYDPMTLSILLHYIPSMHLLMSFADSWSICIFRCVLRLKHHYRYAFLSTFCIYCSLAFAAYFSQALPSIRLVAD